jgi:hypothetical protein
MLRIAWLRSSRGVAERAERCEQLGSRWEVARKSRSFWLIIGQVQLLRRRLVNALTHHSVQLLVYTLENR